MRKTLQLLIAAALSLLVVGAASSAPGAAQAAQTVTLSGTLASVHEDTPGLARETDQFFLSTADAQYELKFSDGGPDGENGAQVTVTGQLAGHTLHVASSKGSSFRIRKHAAVSMVTTGGTTTTSTGSGTMQPSTVSPNTPAQASLAVILANFTDLATQPFTAAQAADAAYGSGTSAKSFYEEESKGRMTVTGAVFGWYTLPTTAASGCNWTNWVTLASNAATAAGVNLSAYTNQVFVFPSVSSCGWAGLGYVPGSVSVLNGTLSVQVMTHELGHNFGLGHANAISCTVNGVRVALSTAANCTDVPYADPFSTMGNNALRHNHGSELGELGWLSDSEKVVGAPGNTYTISPYFSDGPVKLVRVPRGDGTYFNLDFRMTYGFDSFAAGSPAVSGVTIRLDPGTASPSSSPKATELIDTTPATASLADAPLLVGRTFTDPVSSISFNTLSVSSSGVVVQVGNASTPSTATPTPPPPAPAPAPTPVPGSTDTQPPTVPQALGATAGLTSVSLAWTASTDDTSVTGYVIGRNGSQIATVGGTAFGNGGLRPNTTYTYTVAALDAAGNRSSAATVTVTTLADRAAPTTPRWFHRARQSGRYVTFAWSASRDNVRVARYAVYKVGRAAPVAWTTRTSIRIYTQRGANYYVRAFDTSGNASGRSNWVRVRW